MRRSRPLNVSPVSSPKPVGHVATCWNARFRGEIHRPSRRSTDNLSPFVVEPVRRPRRYPRLRRRRMAVGGKSTRRSRRSLKAVVVTFDTDYPCRPSRPCRPEPKIECGKMLNRILDRRRIFARGASAHGAALLRYNNYPSKNNKG